MPYDPAQHHRHSIRLRGLEYNCGAYFVTICTQAKECILGEIREGQASPSSMGRLVLECWNQIPRHYPAVTLDEFVLMPNHVHGILWLKNDVGAGHAPPSPIPPTTSPSTTPVGAGHAPPSSQRAASLANVIGSFKSASTRRINESTGIRGAQVWQRNYFEHVIRDDESLAAIRQYIRTNPQRWHGDVDNPHGDGSDDVEAWASQLARQASARQANAPERRTMASKHRGDERRDEGGACPAPTGTVVGARHASPFSPAPKEGGACPAPTPSINQGGACPAPTSSTAPLPAQQRAGHAPPLRIGHGYDIHRIQPGGRMVLGGVEVSTTHSFIAHSDGDVVLHALVDALLGAIGKGDIGEMFPNTDERWRNADSRIFVQAAMNEVRSAGYQVANADITILAERPKLKPHKPEMMRIISSLINAPVNIKAGTNEGCDAVGQEQAIACHAVVLLMPSA